MELLANRSFSGDEVKQMLTGLYEVLAKAEKYAKEKEQEAEAANVRSRALEKVILYGDFQEGTIMPPPPPPSSPPKQQQQREVMPQSPIITLNNNDNNIIVNNATTPSTNTTPSTSRLHYSRTTNAAQVLKSAIKETASREKMKYEHEIEKYKVEHELFQHQLKSVRKELEQTKLERDSHQRALITAVEKMRAETELKWRREMELAVRAESSRVKQWAEDRVAKKERVLLKRYQKNMDKKELEGYEKAMKKMGKRAHYQIAHEAIFDEKVSQVANKKIGIMQKKSEAAIKAIQDELNEAKEACKKMKADRDQARAELRVNKRGLRQHLEKLKSEMEVKHGVHIKEKERTHRQELQKHVRKVINAKRLIKAASTSNKIKSSTTKKKRLQLEQVERKVVKIVDDDNDDRKILATTTLLEKSVIVDNNNNDRKIDGRRQPPLAVAVAVEDNTMIQSPRTNDVLNTASPTPNTPTGFEDFE